MQDPRQIHIHASARERLAALRDKSGNPGLVLRLVVEGGGCSGFQYAMALAPAPEPGDLVYDGLVATDPISLGFLNGSEVSFESGLLGASFHITNPNAASGCGCGVSFSMKESARDQNES